MTIEKVSITPHHLMGGGEMGERMRALDWSATAVGPVESWPAPLKSAVNICLNSQFPMFIWWGAELTMFYNDAYRPALGRTKHPMWLGRSARDCWQDIWDVVGPMAEGVFRTGESTWSEDLMLIMDRNLPREEVYFTFSYSPIFDQHGVSGMFCACTETTDRVIGERRLQILRDLGARASAAKEANAVCEAAMEILAHNAADVPFALVYLLDDGGEPARLAAQSGFCAEHRAAPDAISLQAAGAAPWPLDAVAASSAPESVRLDEARFGALPGGVWPESPESALVLPLAAAGQAHLAGFLVMGLSPRRLQDDEYRTFCNLAAGHIATGIANASAYDAARKRAEALAQLDRAKTAFFSNVSHEFRTPLTLVLGPIEDALVDESERLGPAQRRRAEVVHRNGLRLLQLVNALLDFSRIEAGRAEARYEPTDLSRLTADLASSFRSAVERAGLQLVVDCPPLPEPAYVDPAHWEKIVLNLLSNAVKFTFEGEIAVRTRVQAHEVRLEVTDTGVGIPAAELPKIFERFHRVGGARARTHEGSGIGLALVQEMTRLHGGTVAAESTEGKGTRFVVTLPLGNQHLPTERCVEPGLRSSVGTSVEPMLAQVLRWLPEHPDVAPQDEYAPRQGPAVREAEPARILLVDDNADMCEYVARLLRPHYRVETAVDGEAALDAAHRRPPDLVLSDVMMPRMDGVGLLRELRSDPKLREVPVILLSARAGEEARIDGLKAGADDYMIKPFTAKELLARVQANLQLKQLRERAREELRQSEATALRQLAEIETTYETAPIGLCVIDADLRYVRINERMAEINGVPSADHIGRSVREILPDMADKFEGVLRRVLRTGASIMGRKISGETPAGLGVHRTWLQSCHPLRDEQGTVVGVNVVAEEITEQERFTAQIREQAARLREADRRKDDFLAMLAHELRNPLAPIRNAVQLMQITGTGDPRTQRAQDILERQTALLARLIDDLLDVSRITRGKIRLKSEPVELQQVIEQAVELSASSIDTRSQRLSIALPSETMSVCGDRMRLAQVISNLLTNASKFTDPGGEIWLEGDCEDGQALVRVRDTGCGIREEVLPTVFDPFVQAPESLSRSSGGLGLGLALVRNLVELHGGSVSARSGGIDRGSEFTIRLPLA